MEQVGLGRWGVEMEIRKEEIKLRVTRDEKEMIEAAAARAGVPVAAWVRMVALQEVRKTVLRERKEER